MEFGVLGPMGVRRASTVTELSGRMQQILLGVLLVRANRAVSPDALVDALWSGRRVDRSEQKLQLHVHRLRRLLGGSDRLTFGAGGYRLEVLPDELDADRFETLIDEAIEISAQDPTRCVELVGKALALWRGMPFEGLDVPELASEAERLLDRRLTAVEVMYEAELVRGRESSVIADLTDLARRYPLRERLHGLLMAALYRTGRQADALQVYRDARRTLVDELGLEPGPELRELEQRILNGEPVDRGGPTGQPHAPPAQLLADVPGFAGREAELADLDAVTGDDDAAHVVVITGTAGVGKTALAIRWSHRARERFSDGQLYVDLRGYGPDDPISPADALAGFLRALGVEGAGLPDDLAERSARFRSLVDGRRMLIVLDNARSADQVRPLLPGAPSCCVLVTSRQALSGLSAREGAHRMDLGALTDDEAVGLLRGVLSGGDGLDSAAVRKLAELCARLPLALRIAAERLREHSVVDLTAELADQQARLDVLDTGEDAYASVRSVFSWSYGRLSPDAAGLFRKLGLHPGRDLDVYALCALAGTDLRTTRRLLASLVRAHLVERVVGERYRLHDLLWTYAAELAQDVDGVEDRELALRRLVDYYLHVALLAMESFAPEQGELPAGWPASEPAVVPRLRGYESASAWLDAERGNIVSAVERSAALGDGADAVRFSAALWCYLDTTWQLDDARRLHTLALRQARELADPVAEGIALFAVGLLHHRTERNTDAVRDLGLALASHRANDDRRQQVLALNYLGAACCLLERMDAATQHLEEALELARRLESDALQVNPGASLGLVYLWLGRYEEAFRVLTQARELAVSRGIRWAQPRILANLGEACYETGRYDEARDHLLAALQLAQDGRLLAQEINVLHILGVVLERLNDPAAAMKHHERALSIARTLRASSLEASAWNGLAESHLAQGSIDEAEFAFDRTLDVLRSGEASYEEARAQEGLGRVRALRGDRATARRLWEQAHEIYRRRRSPRAEAVAEMLAETDVP